MALIRPETLEGPSVTITDIGPQPPSFNLEHEACGNESDRSVVWSGRDLQVTLMSTSEGTSGWKRKDGQPLHCRDRGLSRPVYRPPLGMHPGSEPGRWTIYVSARPLPGQRLDRNGVLETRVVPCGARTQVRSGSAGFNRRPCRPQTQRSNSGGFFHLPTVEMAAMHAPGQ